MTIVDITNNKNNIIKKKNELIEAKGSLSKNAIKMITILIGMIRKDDEDFQKYAISLQDYKNKINTTTKKAKEDFIKNAEELMSNPFIIDRQMFNWCSKVDWKTKEGYFIFNIHPDLKPYLLQLKENYTSYNLTNILNLKSKYSIRLYELLIKEYNTIKNYKKKKEIISFNITIDKLKEILKLPKTYKYGMFKKQVLEKAKQDLKDNTNIQFNYEEIKLSRKVYELKINIFKNDKGSNDYLKDLDSFKKYIREKYKPDPTNEIFPTVFENNGKKYGIDNKGLLYVSEPGKTKTLSKKEAKEQWDILYALACLDPTKF